MFTKYTDNFYGEGFFDDTDSESSEDEEQNIADSDDEDNPKLSSLAKQQYRHD